MASRTFFEATSALSGLSACAGVVVALEQAGQPFKYLEYGSYLGRWRERNALKLWTGWPTFPMVFVKGMLVGGSSELQALIDSGELKRLLSARDGGMR